MGPAILLCPSSTAVQLLGQVSPSKNTRQRDGIFSLSNGNARHVANVHWTGDFMKRPAPFLQSAATAGKCRKNNYSFAWRRVFAAAAAAAAGGEVSVEEPAVVSEAVQIEQPTAAELPTATEETPAAEPKPQARRNLNRSNSSNNRAVVVSPAELVTGATFPGKVTTIQPFGAFVDLGAFTNGLVHISRLSKAYVKKVEDVVQIGQDVKVQVLDVDLKANRISLMLVEEEKEEVQWEGEVGENQPQRPPQQQGRTPTRRNPSRRPAQSATATKMKKGEIVVGTVKNMIRSGVFVTLPDGTDGYLPIGEVIFRGPNTNLESLFQVGQEVTVRVLRIERGRVTLTTKQEVDYDKINEALNKDVVGGATNPFEIAFRRNELIANFLAEREKQKTEAEPGGAAKEDKEEGPSAEVAATDPESGAASEQKTEQEEAADSVEEVKDAVEEPVKEVKLVAETDTAPTKVVIAPAQPEVVASVEKVDTSDSKVKAVAEVDTTLIKEILVPEEPAVEEQVVASVEEVANSDEEVKAVKEEDATPSKEVSVPEEPATEEKVAASVEDVATSDVEASPSEVSDAKELVKEGVDVLKDAVAAVEEAIVEQAGAAVEEVVNLIEEAPAKGDTTVVEETVQEVIAVTKEEAVGSVEEEAAPVVGSVEEPVVVEEPDQKAVEEAVAAVEEVVAEKKEEEKVTLIPEPPLEGEAKEIEEESESRVAANNEDVKEIANDNAVLHTAEVVGANVQQS